MADGLCVESANKIEENYSHSLSRQHLQDPRALQGANPRGLGHVTG